MESICAEHRRTIFGMRIFVRQQKETGFTAREEAKQQLS